MTRYLYALAILCAWTGVAVLYGEHRMQIEWDLEIARQEAKAEQARDADLAARKADEDQHRKDIENAKSKAGRAAVAAWVKSHGLLPDGACRGQADGTGEFDGSAGQSGTGDSIEEFARGCALDAQHVLRWQEWAVREGLEIVE